MPHLVVGTVKGLYELAADGSAVRVDGGPAADREVTALAAAADGLWVLVEGSSVLRRDPTGSWVEVASASGLTCLLPGEGGLLVGAEPARLLALEGGALRPLPSFDAAPARQRWYTPWGGPPAVRSMARDQAGRLHVNVHVGGIPRSEDGGRTWRPTIDVDADVHQVLAHPALADVVLAATARGLARSDDGGTRWWFERDGMQGDYCRAVAVAGGMVLVSASTGPSGRRAAVYRAPLEGPDRFERCAAGLPEWFDANVDTGCLAAAGDAVVLGTADGSVFRSGDAGATWTEVAGGLPAVCAVTLA